MNSHAERERIKRVMGIGEYQCTDGYWEILPGITRWYIYVEGQKYEATLIKGELCTWISGRPPVCADSLDQLRDKVIAALAEKDKEAEPKFEMVTITINGVRIPVPTPVLRGVFGATP